MSPRTPGPWAYLNSGEIVSCDPVDNSATDDVICVVAGPAHPNADGNLIAAAPELYGRVEQSNIALEEAAKLLEGTGYSGCADIMRGYVVKNDAALAKARGDQ